MPRCPKIIGILSHALCAIFLLVISSNKSLAYTPVATNSATVTATVPEQSFNAPTLITPTDNSTHNNPYLSFTWNRPSPLPSTPLDHYDFYLDDVLFAQGINDTTTPQDFYFYTVYINGNVFQLDLKSALSQGYHTWKVTAFNQNNLSATSETRTFYIDSVSPHIKLISIDSNTLNWNSGDLNTIPPIQQRFVYVTQNPLLTGTSEPYANVQFTLMCPFGVLNCNSSSEIFNYSSGSWQHRFYNLIPNKAYPVYISSTDPAGNIVNFPVFYIIYLFGPTGSFVTPTVPPTPTIVITPLLPSPSITLPASPSATPSVEITPTTPEIFTPSDFLPIPPPPPPPPPVVIKQIETVKKTNYSFLFFIFLVFGLPLHLAMAQFGAATKLIYTHKFLFTLLLPFVKRKKYQTHPFATIIFYNPKITYESWQIVVSDINGFYSLKENFPKEFYLKASSKNRNFRPCIVPSEIIPKSCIYLVRKDHENHIERLQSLSMNLRIVPLICGLLTSSIALYLSPSYFLLVYLYLSAQYTFSEYLYPKYSK